MLGHVTAQQRDRGDAEETRHASSAIDRAEEHTVDDLPQIVGKCDSGNPQAQQLRELLTSKMTAMSLR